MKRTIAFLLALLTLLQLTACSAKNPETETQETEDTSAEIGGVGIESADEETETNERDIPDMLPELSFNGKELRVANEAAKEYEIHSEELNGEVTNDAVYNRNLVIEERFEAKISAVVVSSPHDDIVRVVTAGDNPYDICGCKAYQSYIPVFASVLLNWNEIPYIDFEKPWYYRTTNDNAEINGRIYNLSSYLAITALLDTYAMFFNERICTDYGFTARDLYDIVYSDQWVYDEFERILSGIYEDTNGNGVTDKDDTLGYVGGTTHALDIWLAAFDQPILVKDEAGELQIEILTDKTVSALEKIYNLTYNNPASFRENVEYSEYQTFANSNAAFTPLPFHTTFAQLRTMEDDYGILPLPKWDEQQEKYCTHIYDQYTVYNLPRTLAEEDYEFIGIMTEALSAETYKTVYPAYYDVALKSKYVSDPDAAAMIDIIMEGAGIDLSYMFSYKLMSLSFTFRDLINSQKTDIASYIGKLNKAIGKMLGKLYDVYSE